MTYNKYNLRSNSKINLLLVKLVKIQIISTY